MYLNKRGGDTDHVGYEVKTRKGGYGKIVSRCYRGELALAGNNWVDDGGGSTKRTCQS